MYLKVGGWVLVSSLIPRLLGGGGQESGTHKLWMSVVNHIMEFGTKLVLHTL